MENNNVMRVGTQRLEYIDQMKGLCIIAITLLHFENGFFPDLLNRFIGLFMITGFYVTTGWLWGLREDEDVDIKVFAQKRFRSLGIPYLWFSLILLAFDVLYLLLGHIEWPILLRDVYKTFVLRGIGTLWFLPVLFFGELLFVFVSKVKKLPLWFVTVLGIVLIVLLGQVSRLFTGLGEPYRSLIKAPFSVLDNTMVAWLLITWTYSFSRYWRSLNEKVESWKGWIGIMGGVLSVACFALTVYCGNRFEEQCRVFQVLLHLLTTWVEPLGTLLLFVGIGSLCGIVGKYLGYWGRNSLILMATHYSISMEICIYLNKTFFHESVLYGWAAIIAFICTMIVEYPLSVFINRKCKFLLGKR